MPDTIRTFVGFAVPASKRLGRALDRLKALDGRLKVADPSQLHVTLKFLGESPIEQMVKIGEVLDQTSGQYSVRELSLSGVGAFPDSQRPRVVWAGVQSPPIRRTTLENLSGDCSGARTRDEISGQRTETPLEPVSAIAQELEERFAELGFPRENRPFTPHLTLARVKGHVTGLSAWLEEFAQQEFGQIELKELRLYQSELTRSGPFYSILSRHRLATV